MEAPPDQDLPFLEYFPSVLGSFVVQMPVGEIAAGVGEGAELRKRLHCGDAREFLAEVVGAAAAVVRGMQERIGA